MEFVKIDKVIILFEKREYAVAGGFENNILNLEAIADEFYKKYFVVQWDFTQKADKTDEEIIVNRYLYAINPDMVFDYVELEYPVFGEGNTRRLADEVKRIFEEKYMKNAEKVVVRIPRRP